MAGAAASGILNAQTPPAARSERDAVPVAQLFLNSYCAGCHSPKLKAPAGSLALPAFDLDSLKEEDAPLWERVVRKLRARAMPPPSPGRSRPDEAAYTHMIAMLETSLDSLAARNVNPGRTATFHRLNRTEYRNAVRDLLALDIDVDGLLPADNASHGFDNVNVGGLSPTLVEQYLSAARKISRLAIGVPPRTPDARTVLLPLDRTQDDHVDGLPYGTRGGTLFAHTFPVDGEYVVQIRLSRNRDEQIEGFSQPLDIELLLDGERVRLFHMARTRPTGAQPAEDEYASDDADLDAGLTARVQVPAGSHTVGATFLSKSGYPETARQPFRADFNQRSLAAIFSVSVAGPYGHGQAGDTSSRRRVFVCQSKRPSEEAGCAKRIASTLSRRAYRRAVTDADVVKLLAYYEAARAEGGSFETGIEMIVRAVIASPDFLFRIERDPEIVGRERAYRVSDVALASRLSFFLWSSIPDEELLDMAVRGKLRAPGVLERQVRRMLADERSIALVDNFAEQWLYLRNLSAVSPDPKLFPDFDDNLRQAFRRETRMFFESIKNENRSVLDLLNADYTFVNDRLADHYGIPNVYGTHFRRVSLPSNGQRSGLLGHASILTVTSYANRTSPVQRGKWVLDNLLGMPPPPPPPNVPPLKENARTAGAKPLSVRERMVEHRANPVCASCHSVMDPIGLSMENFDATGRWREREGVVPVDASGGFVDGSTFEGAAGLRRALLSRPDLFVTTLTEKLLTYAVGRSLEYSDAPSVRRIVRGIGEDDYRFSALVLEIVRSAPFQMRSRE